MAKTTSPWLLWVSTYFYVMATGFPEKNFKSVVLKVMPNISLIFLIAATSTINKQHKWDKVKIIVGLLFSVVGDAFMVWKEDNKMMIFAGIAFGLQHLCYIWALGLKHRSGISGFLLPYGIFTIVTYIIYPHLPKQIYSLLVPGYLLLLCTMCGCASARFLKQKYFGSLCACIGGYLFVISDVIILMHKFVKDVEHADFWIMITYYTAQLGIALSVVFYQDPKQIMTKEDIESKKQ